MADARTCTERTLVRYTLGNWSDKKSSAEETFLHADLTNILLAFGLVTTIKGQLKLCRQIINLLKPTGHVMHQQF